MSNGGKIYRKGLLIIKLFLYIMQLFQSVLQVLLEIIVLRAVHACMGLTAGMSMGGALVSQHLREQFVIEVSEPVGTKIAKIKKEFREVDKHDHDECHSGYFEFIELNCTYVCVIFPIYILT